MSFSSDSAGQSNQLPETIDLPDLDNDEFVDKLRRYLKIAHVTINTKEAGLYEPLEKISFKQYFTRDDPSVYIDVYRQVFDLVDLNGGNIAVATAINLAHNIDDLVELTNLYGSAHTTGGDFLPLPNSSPILNENIEIKLNSTNISITKGAGIGALDKCLVVVEYTKN